VRCLAAILAAGPEDASGTGNHAVVDRRAIGLAVLTGCGLLVVLLGGVILIPRLLYPPLSPVDLRGVAGAQVRIQLQQDQSQLADSVRAAVLRGLAGLVVVVGGAAAWWQVRISREGQITERFSKAVDQLGSPNGDVRIGGLYALERIARNSAADRNAILFLLGPSSAPVSPGRWALPAARSIPPRPWMAACHG
jgi:hypothetical protein